MLKSRIIHIPTNTQKTLIEDLIDVEREGLISPLDKEGGCRPGDLGGARNVTITVAEGARLDYFLSGLPEKATVTINLEKNSQCNWHLFGIASGHHDLSVTINHGGEGCEGNMVIGFRGEKKSRTVMKLTNNHIAPHTSGVIRFRGLGADESLADISGLIKIGLHAPFTNSHLFENILSLSDKSRVKAEPNLEILNNEVVCSHAAAVGSVDEEALHYLSSRGLTPEQGKELMTRGFLRVLLPEIKNPEIAKAFEQAIQ